MDKSICPLCSQQNRCNAEGLDNDCWCFNTEIPSALIKKAKILGQNPTCICQTCITRFVKSEQNKACHP